MRCVLLLIAFSAAGCGFFRGRGQFAFTVADHTNLPVLEQHFFQPQRFVKPSTKPIFERDDVLWYAYRPWSVKNGKFYGISLQKKSLGYQEIDLRNRTIVEGQGKPGSIKGTATIGLRPLGETTIVDVAGTVQAAGPIARVGQRLIGGVAKMMQDRFFACLNGKL